MGKFVKKSINDLAGDSEEMEASVPNAEPTRFAERSIMLGVSVETPKGWLKGATSVRLRDEIGDFETIEEVSERLGKLAFETAKEDFSKLLESLRGGKR